VPSRWRDAGTATAARPLTGLASTWARLRLGSQTRNNSLWDIVRALLRLLAVASLDGGGGDGGGGGVAGIGVAPLPDSEPILSPVDGATKQRALMPPAADSSSRIRLHQGVADPDHREVALRAQGGGLDVAV
jgi:hypothetical protein